MRRTQKFLLTVLLPEEHDNKLICGKVKYIPTGSEITFSNIDELVTFVYHEINTSEEKLAHSLEPS